MNELMNKYIGRNVKMIKRNTRFSNRGLIFDIGQVVTIIQVFGDPVCFKAGRMGDFPKFGIIFPDEFVLDLVDLDKIVLVDAYEEEKKNNIEDLKNKQSELQKELSLIDDKIKFMEESKTETFNENEFKIYQALKTLGKEGLTDFEKAKIINDIINPKN